jgi:excisionase family DNA binding protein
MSEKPWLTVIEAAEEMGVGEKTMRRAIAAGGIPYARQAGPRGSIRIPREALATKAWSARGSQPTFDSSGGSRQVRS